MMCCIVWTRKVLFVGLVLWVLSFDGFAQAVSIDASATYAAPVPSSYQPGNAVSPDGRILGLNDQYLTLNGKPWLPVMGEFHYTRVPEADWEEEILKMKAAGVQIIATYVIWLHHEEVEGQFDWSGDRDLRRFVQLCHRHGMYVYVRIGPWAHGEARHGGFPDWLLTKGPTRRDAPEYMSYVDRYYAAVGDQLHGLLWKDGGSVIGIQLENEYADRSAGGGDEYLLALKKLALKSGLDVPFYSVTGWDDAVVPHGAVVPVFGGYADAPWDDSLKPFPPAEVYAFRFGSRVTGNMGMMGGKPAATNSNEARPDTPFITAEMGGGIQDTYHRRPVLSANDVAAMFPVMLGSGVNLYGTYMFQGGQNPDGKLTTLEESQATGYPTDVPIKSYDFQAPLSQYGEEQETFRKLKVVDYFLNGFGDILAPMLPHAPSVLPQSPTDLSVPRLSVRTKGQSGFLFMNNYVRGASARNRPNFQVDIKLPGASILVPNRPIDIPSGVYYIWPFNMNIGGATLRYSTAQLFTSIKNGPDSTYFFFCIPNVRCEFSFVDEKGVSIEACTGKIRHQDGSIYVEEFIPGLKTTIVLHREGVDTAIVVLSQQEAENLWKVHIQGKDRMMLTQQQFFANTDKITLRSDASPSFKLQIFPALQIALHASQPLRSSTSNNVTEASARLTNRKVSLVEKQVQQSKPVPAVRLGPPVTWRSHGVAEMPDESTFADAARFKLSLGKDPLSGLSDAFLKIKYKGDVARLSDGTHLLDDDFYNGMPWTIGLKRYIRGSKIEDLELSILPLRIDSPIFLEPAVRKELPARGEVEKLQSVQVVPQYQLTIDTNP